MAEIHPTEIENVLVIKPKRFGDARGFFSETYRADWDIAAPGLPFVQDNHAFSATPNTIRGLHFQFGPSTQAKLLRCIAGAILDVAVDIRRGSPTFGKCVAVELSAENNIQLLVPHGFAHAYQTLLPDTHVLYKVDRYYDPKREGAVRWNDPEVAVPWRELSSPPVLSGKDEAAPLLSGAESPFVYDTAAPYNCRAEDPAAS